jgi:hypothetical protein
VLGRLPRPRRVLVLLVASVRPVLLFTASSLKGVGVVPRVRGAFVTCPCDGRGRPCLSDEVSSAELLRGKIMRRQRRDMGRPRQYATDT